MRKFGLVVAAGLLLTSQAVFAAETVTTFDFTNDDFDSSPYGYGNTYEMTEGSLTIDITAWADTGNNGAVEDARVSDNNHGLLVYNRNSGDNHYVDNSNGRDMLLFDFNKSVALTKLNIGYTSNDSDMVIIGFNTLPTFSGSTWSSIASSISSGTSAVFELINAGTGWSSFNTGGFEAKYWLVGTYNKYFGSNSNYEGASDYIKLAGLKTSHDDTLNPPTNASAPATMGLIFASLVFMWQRRRTAR